MIDPNAPTARRLMVARVLLVVVAVVAAYTASFRPADIVAMVAWAFSLAAGGLFPALVLGHLVEADHLRRGRRRHHRRVRHHAALPGGDALLSRVRRELPRHDLAVQPGHRRAGGATWRRRSRTRTPTPLRRLASKVGWFNINNISSALFGLPLGFAVMIVVSLLTPAPSPRDAELHRRGPPSARPIPP